MKSPKKMQSQKNKKVTVWILFTVLMLVMQCLSGCNLKKDSKEKVRDLEFSVIGEEDIPQELKSILAEKLQAPFKLTYTDEKNLYIAIGYGPQNTGGYSIAVEELYLTDNSIVADTELKGPQKGENVAQETSYPFIVIQTELLENPVVFK